MSYDAWKESAPEEDSDPPVECPVCTGNTEAPPCGEECARLIEMVERKNRSARLHVAAESALYMARRYLDENPNQDRRVVECIDQAEIYLRDMRALRVA